jgi:hypothetical protein
LEDDLKGGEMHHGEQKEGEGREEGLLRPVLPHELQELHRKLRGTLLQLETLMRRTEIPFKCTVDISDRAQ